MVRGLLFCAVLAWPGLAWPGLAWSGWLYFHEAWTEGWVTETVWAPPLWIVLLPLSLGIGVLALQYLADIACLVTGREPPFGLEPVADESTATRPHPEELE